MLKKLMHTLEELPVTIFSGVCLLFSLVFPYISGEALPLYLDPAWIALLLSGTPLVYSAIRKLIYARGISKISSALLICIAMIAAVAIGDLFAAGEVAFIMALGEILEDKTTERARRGLSRLISLAPQTARVVKDGTETEIGVFEIRVGDILRILPGEAIATDGVVVSGESSIDQSIITGESLPVEKKAGDEVYCGTINRFGSIDIRATKAPENSSLQKLIRMVEEAEKKEAPVQRIADKWASILVPCALVIAILSGLIKWAIGAPDYLTTAVTVLVVFCPCALVLATPTAIMAAIGQAAKRGVIIKSGEALEKMGKVDTLALDKTGTLTHGTLSVSDIVSFDTGYTEERILSLAASAEARSEHPIARAILAYAAKKSVSLSDPTDFRMASGKGVSASIEGKTILCGNEKYLAELGIDLTDEMSEILAAFASVGKATMLVATDARIIGIIALADTLRKEARETLTKLHKIGTKSVLLTGDNKNAARYIARQVGIDEVHAELLPEEKVAALDALKKEGRCVAMIGDGVNDAPALKCADVGVAMGTMGSDIAVEAADVALMSDDLSRLPYLKRLSNATVNTIRLGIALSLGINFAAIVLSVLGLLNPTTGALVHNAGSVLVVLIAALLYDRRFD